MKIESEELILFNSGSTRISFNCYETSSDEEEFELNVKLPKGDCTIRFERDEVERMQAALLNYLNTGSFDQEG